MLSAIIWMGPCTVSIQWLVLVFSSVQAKDKQVYLPYCVRHGSAEINGSKRLNMVQQRLILASTADYTVDQ